IDHALILKDAAITTVGERVQNRTGTHDEVQSVTLDAPKRNLLDDAVDDALEFYASPKHERHLRTETRFGVEVSVLRGKFDGKPIAARDSFRTLVGDRHRVARKLGPFELETIFLLRTGHRHTNLFVRRVPVQLIGRATAASRDQPKKVGGRSGRGSLEVRKNAGGKVGVG